MITKEQKRITLNEEKVANLKVAIGHIDSAFNNIRSAREKTVNDEWQRLEFLKETVHKCMNMLRNEAWFQGREIYKNVHKKEDSIVFDIDDYLLIRNGEVIAISGNSEFEDGDEVAMEVETGDSIAKVISTKEDSIED